MKKSLVALAVLAASGAAMAQSSVTLFGTVDVRYAVGKGSTSSKTQLSTGGIGSSKIGFRGTEDLGGGMKANFWLEGDIGPDDGSARATSTNNQPITALASAATQGLTFNRRSTLGLEGGMGELRLGRDYTTSFYNDTLYDPFTTNGIGTNINAFKSTVHGLRYSNSIAWHTPSVSGFSGIAATWLGENASTAAKAGQGNGLFVKYANGPLLASYASSKSTVSAGVTSDSSSYGAAYDLGVVRLMALSNKTTVTAVGEQKGRLVGLTAPVAGGQFRLSQAQFDNAGKMSKQMSVGFVNPLSKRTSLYAVYARIGNSGGASTALNGGTTAANASSTGYDFGINHTF